MKVEASNYIESEILTDIADGRYGYLQTRHPPEPSGYLHIAHVRGIMLNYGLAKKHGGVCNLRFDDTNPLKESQEFVDAIQNDVKWLGFQPNNVCYATDYFHFCYEVALKLIKEGLAYVCDLTMEEAATYRGTLTQPGKDSPYRNRSIAENLELFEGMRLGEYAQGSRCLRAKIDMAHPNILMRDPVIYKIQYASHHRIGKEWNIYPTYDFNHPLSDSREGVTHSICGSEFIEHRPLYDWVVGHSGLSQTSRQVEYYNLYIDGVVLGKRHMKRLVNEGRVNGFDDPRLFTLAGLRRRGILPESLKNFALGVGLSKSIANVDLAFVESFFRETLNSIAKRTMAVLNPVKLIITNYPEGKEEDIILEDYPQNENTSKRTYKFGRELLIEASDFMEEPIPKYKRLYPGNEVRLKGAYIIKCTGFDKDSAGKVTTVYAEYDPETKSGSDSTKKAGATIHFINPKHAHLAEVRMYQNLFAKCDGTEAEGEEISAGLKINPNSLTVLKNCYVENIDYSIDERYQFIRHGYFTLDSDSNASSLVFNLSIGLKSNF